MKASGDCSIDRSLKRIESVILGNYVVLEPNKPK